MEHEVEKKNGRDSGSPQTMTETIWQPIETAPKNTCVLIYLPEVRDSPDAISDAMLLLDEPYDGSNWGWVLLNGHLCEHGQQTISTRNPTHWMPLPEPPKKK